MLLASDCQLLTGSHAGAFLCPDAFVPMVTLSLIKSNILLLAAQHLFALL
jgi:hypothetical protein